MVALYISFVKDKASMFRPRKNRNARIHIKYFGVCLDLSRDLFLYSHVLGNFFFKSKYYC